VANNQYGTTALDAPVPRADFERALRHLNMSDHELRDAVLQLAARVVALTDELTRRLDGVEPEPAPPNTPAPPPSTTLETAVGAQLGEALRNVRIDYEKRIPQPIDAPVEHEAGFDLVERARLRARAAGVEKKAVADSFADHGPTRAF